MFTTGSKWFFGLGLLSLVLAVAYGWTTGGNGLGPLTAGYKGGVGDHLGYGLLLATAAGSILLGFVSVATRDASPRAQAQLLGTEQPPPVTPPAHPTYWPVVGALGAALVVLGLVISNVMFVAGFIVLAAVLVEWMVLAWSDRATGDPETNRLIRRRITGPLEVPLVGALAVGGGVWAFSRVFLAASKLGAVWAATVIGVVILALGWALATKPRVSRNVVAGVLALAAVAVLAAGVVTASLGEREFHPHEHERDLSPYTPAGTNRATTTTTAEGEG